MLSFAQPLWLLMLIPVALAAWRYYSGNTPRSLAFSPVHRIGTGITWRIVVARTVPVLYILALVLSVLALARPRTFISRIQRTVNAVAIEMVTDVSGSMEALDMSTGSGPNLVLRRRIDAVKETFAAFVEGRPDDLIGLITFGGYVSTRSPLTADHGALMQTLGGVDIPKPTLDENGQVVDAQELLTAIGDALATACARLEKAETKTKVIVLLSDGESNTGIIKPDDAINLAKRMGMKIYSIGIGTTGRAPFRVRDEFGREALKWGEVSIDETVLKRMADATGGKYFNVRDRDGLRRAMESIDKLEKTKVDRDVYTRYREWYQLFLTPACLLAAGASALGMFLARRMV